MRTTSVLQQLMPAVAAVLVSLIAISMCLYMSAERRDEANRELSSNLSRAFGSDLDCDGALGKIARKNQQLTVVPLHADVYSVSIPVVFRH